MRASRRSSRNEAQGWPANRSEAWLSEESQPWVEWRACCVQRGPTGRTDDCLAADPRSRSQYRRPRENDARTARSGRTYRHIRVVVLDTQNAGPGVHRWSFGAATGVLFCVSTSRVGERQSRRYGAPPETGYKTHGG